MMRRLSTRAWVVLMIALGLVATAAGAGLVLSLHGGSPARAAAAAASPGLQPGSTQARADLATMQSLLNSGSAAEQAAILPPGAQFAPGSNPVLPPRATITIRQGTFSAHGQLATVQARLSGGRAVTLGLIAEQGRWYLYDIQDAVQASSSVTYGPAAPAGVQLMSAAAGGPIPDKVTLGTRIPVIFIHGVWPGKPSDFGDDSHPSSMFASVDSIPGTWTASSSYVGTNSQWVDVNGPKFAAYIDQIARLSKSYGGPGEVIVVAYSMGGLVTRYAANMTLDGRPVKDEIAMVVTIGTPNTGSILADAGDSVHSAVCIVLREHGYGGSSFCTSDFTALAGMSRWGSEIGKLPALPSAIPLNEIGGDETFVYPIDVYGWYSWVHWHWNGDGAVATGSSLYSRPGGNETRTPFMNPPLPFDLSVNHLVLLSNKEIIAEVHDFVATWIRLHPVQAAPAPVPAPTESAPALGSEAYWLADGGQWYVHDEHLQISQGPSGLTGTASWNAGGTIITGHVQIAFTVRPDGSLAGTYTTPSTYTYSQQPLPAGFQTPGPGDGPQQGQSFILVPVAPGFAKSVPGNGIGNPYLCQAGLALPMVQSCGA